MLFFYLQIMKGSNMAAWVHQIWENPPDPVVFVFPGMADVNMKKLETKLLVITSTFFVFLLVFFASYLASYSLVTFRLWLRTKEKVFWCLSFVRALFGVFSSLVGFWYIAFDDTLQKDVVNGSSQTSFLAVYIAVGFFIFECTALFTSIALFGGFDSFLVAHHTLSLLGFSTVAYVENTHFFSVVGMLLEMTTPFSCLCWMFLKAKMAHLPIWKLNQVILVHLFHCRTTIEGYFYYKMYIQWENVNTHMPRSIFWMLVFQLTLQFFILTPYWTYKKMGQLFNPVDWNHPELDKKKSESENPTVTDAPGSSSNSPRKRKSKKNN